MILFGQNLTRSAYVRYICPFPSFSIRFAAKFTLYVLSEIKGQNTHTHSCLFNWNSISFTYVLFFELKYWKRKSVSICFLQYQWLKMRTFGISFYCWPTVNRDSKQIGRTTVCNSLIFIAILFGNISQGTTNANTSKSFVKWLNLELQFVI